MVSLVCGLVSDEVCQRTHLTWLRGCRSPGHIELNLLPGAHGVLIAPLLVTRSIEEQETKDVDVPHTIDSCHES